MKKRRALSLFLALLMCMTSLPLSVLATTESTETQIEETITYDDLYAQKDHLTFSWNAFDLTEVPTALINQVSGGKNSETLTGEASIKDCYLLYEGVLDLDAAMPAGDVTFDVSLAQNPTLTWKDSETDPIVPDAYASTNKFGIFENIKIYVDGKDNASKNPYDESYGFIYQVNFHPEDTANVTVTSPLSGNFGLDSQHSLWNRGNTRVLGNYLGQAYSIAYLLDYDADDVADSYRLTFMRDGQLAQKVTTSASYIHANVGGTYTDVKQTCQFGHDAGFAYYSIRLYNITLTAAELQQNQFVDLLKYFKVDIADFATLTDGRKALLYSAFATKQYTDEDMSHDVLAQAVAEQKSGEAYEKLYVTKGLISWFDAFDAEEADSFNGTLPDKSGNGNSFTLSKLNNNCVTEWKYGNGYLDISTGSKLSLSDILDIPTAADASSHYTVEYVFTTLDQEPQTRGSADTFHFHSGKIPYRQYGTTFSIGGMSLTTHYVNKENRAKLQALAAEYQAACKDTALQASYRLELPTRNVAGGDAMLSAAHDGDGDGYATFAEVQANINGAFYTLGQNYDSFLQNGIGLTTFNVPSKTNVQNYDWKDNSVELLRMKENGSNHLAFVLNMTGNGTNTTVSATLYSGGKNVTPSNGKNTGTGNVSNKSILLSQDLASRIYAIRVYDRELSQTEIEQNHFADLCWALHAELGEFDTLTPDNKTALYAQVATLQYTDADAKTTLETAITEAVAAQNREAAELDAKLTAAANAVVQFDGFQVRTQTYAGLRSRYTVNVAADLDGLTVVEVGAIMAVADSFTREQLVVTKGADGYAVAAATGIAGDYVYRGGALREGKYFATEDEKTHFAYTTTFNYNENTYTAAEYQKELIYRAYVVLSDGTNEYVRYIDAVSDNFADGAVSMYELSVYKQGDVDNTVYVTSQVVIAACAE